MKINPTDRIDNIIHLMFGLQKRELNWEEFVRELPHNTTVQDMWQAVQEMKKRGIITKQNPWLLLINPKGGKMNGEVTTGYPEKYLEEFEVFNKQYRSKEEAKDKAKELRSQGWEVKTKHWDFPDIVEELWEVDARKRKTSKNPAKDGLIVVENPIEIESFEKMEEKIQIRKRRRERAPAVEEFVNKEILPAVNKTFEDAKNKLKGTTDVYYGTSRFEYEGKAKKLDLMICDGEKCSLVVNRLIMAAVFSKSIGGKYENKIFTWIWYPIDNPEEKYRPSYVHDIMQDMLMKDGWYKLKTKKFVKYYDADQRPKAEDLYVKEPKKKVEATILEE